MRRGFRKKFNSALLAVTLSVVWSPAHTSAAEDSGASGGGADDGGSVLHQTVDRELFDCRAVACFQRAACNRRVLAALNQIKTTASEVRAYQTPQITHTHIAIQLYRQERLRSFVAPECRPPTSVCGQLPSAMGKVCQTIDQFFSETAARSTHPTSPDWVLPSFVPKITLDGDGESWLRGRWEGWIFLSDQTSVRTWLRTDIVKLDSSKGMVKACSDQGMISGNVKAGMLELSRREPWLFGSRMLLWRSPPHFDDLEGVVLLEIEPGRELQNGVVWLSRALSLPDYQMKNVTDYPCQDKELLDRRNKLWIPNQ